MNSEETIISYIGITIHICETAGWAFRGASKFHTQQPHTRELDDDQGINTTKVNLILNFQN